jgi:hypothetical protein
MVWTKNERFEGLQKWSGHRSGDWVRSRYGLDKGREAWMAVEMVWTQDKKLGELYKWSGYRIGGWFWCRSGLDKWKGAG